MLPLCISAGGSICRTIKLRKASPRHISAADILKFSRHPENAADILKFSRHSENAADILKFNRYPENAADILKIQSASWETAAARRRGMRCNRPMICPESSTVSRE